MTKPKRTKTEPPKHTTHIVRNQSERRGPVLAIAVHSTQSQNIPGTRDLLGVRSWFDNLASDASAQIGIDREANTEVWVHSDKKAWTIGAANSFTENIEFVAFAEQSKALWSDIQLKEGAKWAAYWCLRYGLPAQRGTVRNINGLCVCTKKGIITHKDVTDAGFGSHTDPGPNFPMSRFIELTQYYKRNGWVL